MWKIAILALAAAWAFTYAGVVSDLLAKDAAIVRAAMP